MRIPRILAIALLPLALPALPPGARAADVTAILPVVNTYPGASLLLPITISPDLAGLGVYSIQIAMPINPFGIVGANWQPTGVVQTWGAPFTNVTATEASLAAFGTTPVTSGSAQLATLNVQIHPAVPVPSDIPITLTTFRLNGTTPSTAVLDGLIRVRALVGVEDGAAGGLALAPPAPSPLRTSTRIAFSLPAAAGAARVAVFGVDGRRVRTLASGRLAAGPHEVTWDARDERGARVPAELYFVRLEAGRAALTRRVAVLP